MITHIVRVLPLSPRTRPNRHAIPVLICYSYSPSPFAHLFAQVLLHLFKYNGVCGYIATSSTCTMSLSIFARRSGSISSSGGETSNEMEGEGLLSFVITHVVHVLPLSPPTSANRHAIPVLIPYSSSPSPFAHLFPYVSLYIFKCSGVCGYIASSHYIASSNTRTIPTFKAYVVHQGRRGWWWRLQKRGSQ